MAVCMLSIYKNGISLKTPNNLLGSVRHHFRGKPPGEAKSLSQKLKELNFKDPALHYRVDIGFPGASASRADTLSKRLEYLKRNRKNEQLEKLARECKLSLDLNEVKQDWLKTAGPHHIKKIADHYGVYQHLFGDAYFVPRKELKVSYQKDDVSIPVFYGNVIKPSEASQKPTVQFDSDDKSLWTLILTNPDSHLTDTNAEYVHWFIGNIPGNDITKADTIVDYLQPFPYRGTGFHRHVFVLYKQTQKIDYTNLKKESSSCMLSERTFSTLDFYRERQDVLTPAGLAFFQSDWDKSLTDFFHNTLNMREPVFEYDFPKPYIRPQEWFPLRKPFNLYMDKYKDPKIVAEKYLKEKLKNVHPFKPPKAPLPFPNAEPIPHSVPSWQKLEIRKQRLGWGRVNDVQFNLLN